MIFEKMIQKFLKISKEKNQEVAKGNNRKLGIKQKKKKKIKKVEKYDGNEK